MFPLYRDSRHFVPSSPVPVRSEPVAADYVAFLNARQVRRALQANDLDKAESFARRTIGALNAAPPNHAARSRAFAILNKVRAKRCAAPLDSAFNRAVLFMAGQCWPNGYDTGPDAPDTFGKLCALLDAGGRMKVWDGASDRTIYADPAVNVAFRAWHDFHHYVGRHNFTLDGETQAAERQISHMRQFYGRNDRWESIIRAEVIGQGRYLERHGAFPRNQRAFVESYVAACLAGREPDLSKRF